MKRGEERESKMEEKENAKKKSCNQFLNAVLRLCGKR